MASLCCTSAPPRAHLAHECRDALRLDPRGTRVDRAVALPWPTALPTPWRRALPAQPILDAIDSSSAH